MDTFKRKPPTSRLNLILAPGGTGKSRFIVDHPELNCADGDSVIATYIGWPKEPDWWRNAKIMETVARNNERCIRDYARTHPDTAIFFNGQWTREEGDNIVGVVIDEAKLRVQLLHRSKITKRVMPTADEISSNMAHVRAVCGERVFGDFKTAYMALNITPSKP